MKTKEENLAYAIKMVQRGDTYVSIHNYLKNNCESKEEISTIVKIIDKLEKEEKIKPAVEKVSSGPNYNIIMGGVFLTCGIFSFFFLWNKGWISTVPFILCGIGIAGLRGVIK